MLLSALGVRVYIYILVYTSSTNTNTLPSYASRACVTHICEDIINGSTENTEVDFLLSYKTHNRLKIIVYFEKLNVFLSPM